MATTLDTMVGSSIYYTPVCLYNLDCMCVFIVCVCVCAYVVCMWLCKSRVCVLFECVVLVLLRKLQSQNAKTGLKIVIALTNQKS